MCVSWTRNSLPCKHPSVNGHVMTAVETPPKRNSKFLCKSMDVDESGNYPRLGVTTAVGRGISRDRFSTCPATSTWSRSAWPPFVCAVKSTFILDKVRINSPSN